jgi:hypothetical protein
MPQIWTAPRTWATGELVTAAILNAHVRDNLEFLKSPPTASFIADQNSDYTSTTTSFANVNVTDLALSITSSGGDVLLGFSGSALISSGSLFFDVDMDGARIGGDDGLVAVTSGGASSRMNITFLRLVRNVVAGSHTFKLQWKGTGGTLTLYAGAGTSSGDLHPQFFVREVS